jgi:hypothetical protein
MMFPPKNGPPAVFDGGAYRSGVFRFDFADYSFGFVIVSGFARLCPIYWPYSHKMRQSGFQQQQLCNTAAPARHRPDTFHA